MAVLDLTETELRDRLQWLINLRFIAVAALLAGGLVLHWLPDVRIEPWPVIWLGVCLAGANALFFVFHRRLVIPCVAGLCRRMAVFANLQILIDLVALTVLVGVSGAARSPFAFYYVFHMIIASTLLSRRASYAQAGVASMMFLAVAYTMTPLRPEENAPYFLEQRILLATFTLVTTLFTAVYMATSIVAKLREREAQSHELAQELGSKARQLQAAYESLEEAQHAQTRYMRKVAHELRSPLAAITTTLGVVLQGIVGEVAAKQGEMIQRAESRARQLLATVDALLDLSHSRTARPPEQLKAVDVSQAAENVLELLAPEAEKKHVTLTGNITHGLEPVHADPESINHVLTNLVSNAIKYTPHGGEVLVAAQADDGGVVLTVRDSGIGIDGESLPRVFEEFFRSPRARELERTGTGLGLTIVKSVIDSLGGTIDVESAPGKGSTFTVRIPTGQPEQS